MSNELLTTGQAAKLCSVTPDTVLKWIRSGWLRARRTPGGHHRIDKKDLLPILGLTSENKTDSIQTEGNHKFHYCWEFNGQGKLIDGCRECAVYQMRAQRCYEVVKFATEIGHNKFFCKGSCQDCDYYQLVKEQSTNILMVTDNEIWAAALGREARSTPFNLEVTECEYSCSSIVEHFRPDFVVVDCSLGREKSRDICKHVIEDPRIPHVRVMMAVDSDDPSHTCDKEIFARIQKPFGLVDIIDCLSGVEEESAN